MRKLYYKPVLIILLISIFFSCTSKKNKVTIDISNLQHECVHRLSEVIVYDIFSPPVASRIYAYSNLAWYESLRMKFNYSVSLLVKFKEFDPVPQPEINKNYDFTIAAVRSFFKVGKALTFSKDSLTKTENRILKEFKNVTDEEVYKNSITYGDIVAGVILKRAANDNYKITRGMPKYSVFKEPGKWQQTPPDYADAAEPNWRLITPLLLDSAAQFKPVPPPVFDLKKNSPFYKDMIEVYNVSKQITISQDTIAHYWDDNPFATEHKGHLMFANKKITPGGHWMGIISILCKQTKADELKNAWVYALGACNIFDGFISCFDEKYRSRFVRPITVIRENVESEWDCLLQTPSFPEYTSAHSVITSAVATFLTSQFGDNLAFHDTSEKEYIGLERSFPSILVAAREAGMSRLYGGIHFRSAIENGLKQGQLIGELYISTFK